MPDDAKSGTHERYVDRAIGHAVTEAIGVDRCNEWWSC